MRPGVAVCCRAMRKLSLALLLLLAACGGDDSDDRCVFEGRYEFGYLSEMAACEPRTATLPFARHEEPCAQSSNDITLDSVPYNLFFSCPSGDPVVECEGFANFANGCMYDVYVRRLSP
jgi:hypothetical protein